MKALIVAGGTPPSRELLDRHLKDSDIILAADAGFRPLDECGVAPSILIGDMDSLGEDAASRADALGVKIMRVPSHKNSTDAELAVGEAVRLGADEIVLLGATGGRIDHLLGNLMLVHLGWHMGASTTMEDETQTISLIEEEGTIHGHRGQTVSILPADQDAVVSAEGLEYPLDELHLTNLRPRGVSNVMLGETAKVRTIGPVFICIDKTVDTIPT